MYGSFYETNRRAMLHAWDAWKRTNDDPTEFMDLMRKDRQVIQDKQNWDLMENIAQNKWAKEGNRGALFMWNWAKANKAASEWAPMRWGTNAMISSDQYVNVTLATHMSRMMAFEEVFQASGGRITKDLLRAAEERHFAKMFDNNGLISNEAVKQSAGELALNLDNQVSDFVNTALSKAPMFKPLFMFPRTGINGLRYGLTYVPVANLAGNKKVASVLLAGSDEKKMFEALSLHGVKDTDPNARAIFDNLRAEYKGRMAFGSMLLSAGFAYAMAGNIRSNGPVNANERKLMRDNFGWKPKHIKILGKWVSYAGNEPFDSLLTLVGDIAYYSNDIGSAATDEFMQKALWTITAGFTNKTFMAGLDPLVKLFSGDTSQGTRLAANEVRAFIPMSGAAGVLAKAISSTAKDIDNDLLGFVANRLPIANAYLPERIDVWTGKPINDIDNPFLRFLNAANPVPISDGNEPWRQWLLESGWDGMRLLRKDSTSNYEYSPAERVELYKIMGEMQLWKKVEQLSNSQRLNNELNALRRERADNPDFDYFELRSKNLLTYRALNKLIREAQRDAETILLNRNPSMAMKIQGQALINKLLGQGQVEKARKVAESYGIKIDQLDQYVQQN